jgi:ferredoxin
MMDSLFPDYTPRRKSLCRVRSVSSGKTIDVDPGTLLIDGLRRAGIDVPQQCGGFAICSWCKVRVIEGEEHLSPIGPEEERLFDWGKLSAGERASCQAEIWGDVVVE